MINERGEDEVMQEQIRNLDAWFESANQYFSGIKGYEKIATPAKELSELVAKNLNDSKNGYSANDLQKFSDTFAKVKQIRKEIFKNIDSIVENN